MKRRICYVSGTRADFGLMQSNLQSIAACPDLQLDVLVTGMHLSATYGHTVDEIVAAGLNVCARIAVELEPATGANMARNIGVMVTNFVDALESNRPDMVLLLGDRGEMLAGAIAALHINLPIVHIHGGERSGTVDEPVRHAISKLSHYHFVATQASYDRLVRMGELPGSVFITGAPGLDGLRELVAETREELCRGLSLDSRRAVALMVFHPVLQEAEDAGSSVKAILSALNGRGCQVVALMPNSDSGSGPIRDVLRTYASHPDVRAITHWPRPRFVSWMAACDFMIGNSSAGIIEAASFGTPVLNLGNRQRLRERNANVVDVPLDESQIIAAMDAALAGGRRLVSNIYGDGKTAQRITALLRHLPINAGLLSKTNAY